MIWKEALQSKFKKVKRKKIFICKNLKFSTEKLIKVSENYIKNKDTINEFKETYQNRSQKVLKTKEI